MSKEVDNIIRIPSSIDGRFFRYWFEFLHPFHHLTEREIDVITGLVKKRYELSKVIKDENYLDMLLMSENVKKEVREECNISSQHFQVILAKLRKAGVLIDNKINPRFIPNLKEDAKDFKLMLYFTL